MKMAARKMARTEFGLRGGKCGKAGWKRGEKERPTKRMTMKMANEAKTNMTNRTTGGGKQ